MRANKSLRRRLGLICGFTLNLLSISGQIPEGYYESATGLAEGELKTALSTIIKKGKRLDYGSGSGKTWSGFEKTDLHPEGYVWDMYSYEKRIFPGNAKAPGGMNIEHSVAKSWWGGTQNDAYKDLYHLNPSDANANSARSNYPLGIVEDGKKVGSLKIGSNTFGSEYSGICFEPLDEYKGDFARAYMYMFTCYEDLNWTGTNAPTMVKNEKYPMLRPWSADLLLEWHRNDPVSEKEQYRADEIYKIQENRNPFIDYPEIAEYLWGENIGEPFFFTDIITPILTSPSHNAQIQFDEINYQMTTYEEVLLKGKNIESPVFLHLDGKDAALFNIEQSEYQPTEVEQGSVIKILFRPVQAISAEAELTISGEGIKDRKIILFAKATEDFHAFPAQNITQTSFDAVWTTSSLTNKFYVEVYTKENSFQENILIDSCNFAKTLPQGWKASNTVYFDDSEKEGVRLGTGSNGCKMTSIEYDLKRGGTIEFRAKKWNNDENVDVLLYLNSNNIGAIPITNQYNKYSVEISPIEEKSTIAFEALKSKRFFISDVRIFSGGNLEQRKNLEGYPKWIENTNRLTITNLHPDSTYYYKVTPDIQNSISSEEIEVRTQQIATSIKEVDGSAIRVSSHNHKVSIHSDSRTMNIKIYKLSGEIIKDINTEENITQFELAEDGVYFLQIVTPEFSICRKILVK